MINIPKLQALASALILAGCASTYVAPPANTASRLRIAVPQSEMFASVKALTYPSGRCESPMALGMIGGIARLTEEKGLNMPAQQQFSPHGSIERLIPAGSPVLISLRGMYSGKECIITFSVNPVHGDDYEAVYSWGGGVCHVSLNQLVTSSSGEVARIKSRNAEQTAECSKGFN